jgi:hypothetical protein
MRFSPFCFGATASERSCVLALFFTVVSSLVPVASPGLEFVLSGQKGFLLFFAVSLSVPLVLVIAALDSLSASVCRAVTGSSSPVLLRSVFPLQYPVMRQLPSEAYSGLCGYQPQLATGRVWRRHNLWREKSAPHCGESMARK